MNEITPTYKIALMLMRYHARWCGFLTMLCLLVIYAGYIGVMKVQGKPIDYFIFQHHPHRYFYMMVLIYAGPFNIYATYRLLRHRFANFRLAVLAVESKINQNYESERWD